MFWKGLRNHGQQKPDVVLLHGFLGTPENNFGDLIPWLEKRCNLYTPLLKHKKFDKDFYLRDANKIIKFVENKNLKDVILMGYSDGGEVALICAAKRPELFKRVITWGSIGFYGSKMKPAALNMYHQIPKDIVLQWVKSLNYMIENQSYGTAFVKRKNITMPLMMILGKKDLLNPTEYAQKFAQDLPNVKIKILDCGHAVHEEKKEEFRKIVEKFI